MTMDLGTAQRDLLAALASRGLQVSPQAMDPLQRVDFTRLVQIHDHEERFLFDVFVTSLVTAHGSRRMEGGPNAVPEVTARDVSIALLMLGAAAANAPEAQISGPNKQAVKDSCPYCV